MTSQECNNSPKKHDVPVHHPHALHKICSLTDMITKKHPSSNEHTALQVWDYRRLAAQMSSLRRVYEEFLCPPPERSSLTNRSTHYAGGYAANEVTPGKLNDLLHCLTDMAITPTSTTKAQWWVSWHGSTRQNQKCGYKRQEQEGRSRWSIRWCIHTCNLWKVATFLTSHWLYCKMVLWSLFPYMISKYASWTVCLHMWQQWDLQIFCNVCKIFCKSCLHCHFKMICNDFFLIQNADKSQL